MTERKKVNQVMFKSMEDMLERTLQTPHIPTLIPLDDDNKKNIRIMKLNGDNFITTEKQVQAEKVGESYYTEAETFFPLKRRCEKEGLHLNSVEIDTKILRTRYPNLDFDAYAFDPPGSTGGLEIYDEGRMKLRMYKIKR